MKIQPHKTAFIDLPDPKAVLERELTKYATCFKGDTININHQGVDYLINIVECKPNDQICVVEADINLDFEQPVDYVEKVPQQQNNAMTAEKKAEAELEQKKKEIMRMYKRLDGQQLNKKQIAVLTKEYEEARKRENEFDPR